MTVCVACSFPWQADASGPLLWLLVTSVFMLLRPCHLPQSGRHCTLPLVQGRLLAPSAPFGGAQCQAAAASHIDPLLAIVGGSNLDEIHGSLLPSPMLEEDTTPLVARQP